MHTWGDRLRISWLTLGGVSREQKILSCIPLPTQGPGGISTVNICGSLTINSRKSDQWFQTRPWIPPRRASRGPVCRHSDAPYMGTSLIIKCLPLGPKGRTIPTLRWCWGGAGYGDPRKWTVSDECGTPVYPHLQQPRQFRGTTLQNCSIGSVTTGYEPFDRGHLGFNKVPSPSHLTDLFESN